MKAALSMVLAAALGLSLPVAAQDTEQDKLFSRLDKDGNGSLTEAEMRNDAATRDSWIAVDRDRNGRVTREEFESMNYAETAASPLGSYSAQDLIGAEVRDIFLDPRGKVSALMLEVDGRQVRVPWGEATSAAAGGTRARGEWRMSELLEGAVEIERGKPYGDAADLIIRPTGEVERIVVDTGSALYAHPWRRERFDPARGVHIVPARPREPFDYSALGFAGPR